MATESRANLVSRACHGYITDGVDETFSALGPHATYSVSRTHVRTLPDTTTIPLNVYETTCVPYIARAQHPSYSQMVDLSTGANATVTFVFTQPEAY